MKAFVWNSVWGFGIGALMFGLLAWGYIEGRKNGWKARQDIAVRQMEDIKWSGGGDW